MSIPNISDPVCLFQTPATLNVIMEMQQLANVIMMVADALVPNRHQVISNNHADSAMTTMSQKHIM